MKVRLIEIMLSVCLLEDNEFQDKTRVHRFGRMKMLRPLGDHTMLHCMWWVQKLSWIYISLRKQESWHSLTICIVMLTSVSYIWSDVHVLHRPLQGRCWLRINRTSVCLLPESWVLSDWKRMSFQRY